MFVRLALVVAFAGGDHVTFTVCGSRTTAAKFSGGLLRTAMSQEDAK